MSPSAYVKNRRIIVLKGVLFYCDIFCRFLLFVMRVYLPNFASFKKRKEGNRGVVEYAYLQVVTE